MTKSGPTAKTIERLLSVKHSEDLFVPQCKTGPTPCPVLDAWAMKKSWSKHYTIGYEIKISRADFLGDDKWQSYKDYCHELYFVCPPGTIKPRGVSERMQSCWDRRYRIWECQGQGRADVITQVHLTLNLRWWRNLKSMASGRGIIDR